MEFAVFAIFLIGVAHCATAEYNFLSEIINPLKWLPGFVADFFNGGAGGGTPPTGFPNIPGFPGLTPGAHRKTPASGGALPAVPASPAPAASAATAAPAAPAATAAPAAASAK